MEATTAQPRSTGKIVKCYLLILAVVILGLIPFIATSKLKPAYFIHISFLNLIALLLINLGLAWGLKLGGEIRMYWAARKIVYLPLAMIVGTIIGCSPALLSLAGGKLSTSGVTVDMHLSLWSAITTFTIVASEELWIRGLFLNYCRQYMSSLHLSIVIGLLFMVLHFLNPEINMVQRGPALFLAGALLTLSYLHFKTIWAPIGLHYGNNYFGHFIKTPFDKGSFWGTDGYVTAVMLLACFIVLLVWHSTRSKRYV